MALSPLYGETDGSGRGGTTKNLPQARAFVDDDGFDKLVVILTKVLRQH